MKKTLRLRAELTKVTANKMLVVCASCGRYGGKGDADTRYYIIDSFEQASAACDVYTTFEGLGGSTWAGGAIFNDKGDQVAEVSYNGRVWRDAAAPKDEIKLNFASVRAFKEHYTTLYKLEFEAVARAYGDII